MQHEHLRELARKVETREEVGLVRECLRVVDVIGRRYHEEVRPARLLSALLAPTTRTACVTDRRADFLRFNGRRPP